MSQQSPIPWKPIAITLALVLAILLICVALVMSDVITLTESLL